MNHPLNRNTRRNHFAYLDPVPIERHIEMNDNTIITVVPTATPTKFSTSSHSPYSKKRHIETNNKRKARLSQGMIDKAKKRRQEVLNKKAYRVGKQTAHLKHLHTQRHIKNPKDLSDKYINYDLPFVQTKRIPHLGKAYKPKYVYNYWKECLQYGVPFLNPHQAYSVEDYKKRMTSMRNQINYQKKKKHHTLISFKVFDTLPYCEQLRRAVIMEFEHKLLNIHHLECTRCKFTTLNHSNWTSKNALCTKCKEDPEWCDEDNYVLPTWKDEKGELQYHIPDELKDLRIAEQLLIQRLSPYVPIVHIRNGTFGIKGSCCAFRQDIKDVCNSLPRQKVELIKYVREFVKENGKSCPIKILTVRCTKVMNALKWLKQYHVDYRDDEDLIIDENNLKWMDGNEEAEILSCMELNNDDMENVQSQGKDINSGLLDDLNNGELNGQDENQNDRENDEVLYSVSNLQRNKDLQLNSTNDECIEYSGALGNNEDEVNNPKCYQQIQELKDAYRSSHTYQNINEMLPWPNVTKEAENEFNGIKIFVNTFPWLFPGGVGDVKEPYRIANTAKSPRQWANHLLHYFDGRFAKVKLWSFYVMNYVQRHHNQTSGKFFINNFVKYNCPETIQELKQQ